MPITNEEKINNYREMVHNFIDEWVIQDGLEEWEAFRNFSVDQVLSEYSLSKEQIISSTRIDGANDRGIDAWHVLEEEDGKVQAFLFQSKDTALTESDIIKLVDNFKNLFPVESDNTGYTQANDEVQFQARELVRQLNSDSINLEIKFVLVTSKLATDSLRTVSIT